MAYTLADKLVVAMSAGALFCHAPGQSRSHRSPKPGPAQGLARALLSLRDSGAPRVEVVLVSRRSPQGGAALLEALEAEGLAISRCVLAGGAGVQPYLHALGADLFVSHVQADVMAARAAGLAAAWVAPRSIDAAPPCSDIAPGLRLAFDGDSILFGGDSEALFQSQGIGAFEAEERRLRHEPMCAGPLQGLLLKLQALRGSLAQTPQALRLALVSSRGGPAHLRSLHTLTHWGVHMDEAIFLGGVDKTATLAAFAPHMFFDDQLVHVRRAAARVPAAWVPAVAQTLC